MVGRWARQNGDRLARTKAVVEQPLRCCSRAGKHLTEGGALPVTGRSVGTPLAPRHQPPVRMGCGARGEQMRNGRPRGGKLVVLRKQHRSVVATFKANPRPT